MKRKLLVTLGAVALVAVLLVGIVQARRSDDGVGSAAKAQAPDAVQTRRALAGAPAQLAALHRQADALLPGGEQVFEARLASLKGYPVVVDAWASWCGPCRFELPAFQAQSVALGRRVAFLGINHKDADDQARAFQREFPVSYPSYTDPDGRIARSYGVQGLPFTVFYAPSGRQVLIHQGPYASEAALLDDIRRYAR
ncbi:MAG: TlpA family protein disulfide reductase [Solirubrobacteraceae bacterium]